jgi:hypothetical protein
MKHFILIMFLPLILKFLSVPADAQNKRIEFINRDYRKIDSVAKQLSGKTETPGEISTALTEAYNDTIDKVRSIYCWVIAEKKQELMNISPSSKKTGTQSLQDAADPAELFRSMCLEQRIICEQVSGLLKNRNGKLQKHTWTAVWISNEWYLTDCTMGILKKHPDAWFLPDPAALIFTHFPDNIYFQLIPRRISNNGFIKLPYRDSAKVSATDKSYEAFLDQPEDFIQPETSEYKKAMIWENILRPE